MGNYVTCSCVNAGLKSLPCLPGCIRAYRKTEGKEPEFPPNREKVDWDEKCVSMNTQITQSVLVRERETQWQSSAPSEGQGDLQQEKKCWKLCEKIISDLMTFCAGLFGWFIFFIVLANVYPSPSLWWVQEKAKQERTGE